MLDLNIVDVIGRRLALEPRGNGRYWGVCPFHSKKGYKSNNVTELPTFWVDKNKDEFGCFLCDETGDAEYFLNKFES